jgi:competence protein ComEA
VLAWVVAAVLATLAAVRLLGGGGPSPPPVRIDGQGAPASVAGDTRGSASRSRIYVHVAGAVRRPGLYRLSAHSRVAEALERAGGTLRRAELTEVNLAARVEDGQQVVVPAAGAAPALAAGTGGASAASGGPGVKLSLAAATAEQLEELDGIGPTLAERIIEFRDEAGGFRSIEQLQEVEGIGEKRFASLREAVQP